MGQDRRDDAAVPTLIVSVDAVVRRRLTPHDAMLTFGRSRDSGTHMHVGPPNGRGDCSLSRFAGSVRWNGGWTLRNESDTRPFAVVVGAQRILVPPATVGRFCDWPVGPDGVLVELTTPTQTYEVELRPDTPEEPDVVRLPDGSGPLTMPPLLPASPHERRLLAAKFLSRRQPGLAVGDECAAERARRAYPQEEGNATARAVMNTVARWRVKLEELGHQDLGGRRSVDRVGALLLAYAIITEDDRPLRDFVDDDPRA